MIDRPGNRASRTYALAQSGLLIAFTLVFFLDRRPLLLPPGGVAPWLGTVLCAGGLVLLLFALRSPGGVIQIEPAPRAGAPLVTSGVYAHFRHPIYTGIVALVIGLFLRKPTALVGLSALAVIGFLVLKVRLEERLLLARHPQYQDYRGRTWGLLPWPRRSPPPSDRPR